jgi:hypothetical protein
MRRLAGADELLPDRPGVAVRASRRAAEDDVVAGRGNADRGPAGCAYAAMARRLAVANASAVRVTIFFMGYSSASG